MSDYWYPAGTNDRHIEEAGEKLLALACEHCGSSNGWNDGSQFCCRDCGEKTEEP